MTRNQRAKFIAIVAGLEKKLEQGRSASNAGQVELTVSYVLANQDKPLEDVVNHFDGQISHNTVTESYKAVHDLVKSI